MDTDVHVLGFRRWKREQKRLFVPEHSLVGSWRDTPWPPEKPIKARCRAYNAIPGVCKHGPLLQNPNCRCGLHLFYSMEDARGYTVTSSTFGHVIGIARAGGRVLFDAKYCRAEEAEAVCLIDPYEYAPQIHKAGNSEVGFYEHDLTDAVRVWAAKVARRYGIPMLGLYDAMAHAMEYGVFVDGVKDTPDGRIIVEGVDDVG